MPCFIVKEKECPKNNMNEGGKKADNDILCFTEFNRSIT